MIINVRRLTGLNINTGQKFSVDVESSDTIRVLKEKIEDVSNIPIGQIRLIYAGKLLLDEKLVSDYCILKDATLDMVLGLRGGGITFSDMQKLQSHRLVRTGPSYLRISDGLTMMCGCKNQSCKTQENGGWFTIIRGYLVMDIVQEKEHNIVCPVCTSVGEFVTVGLYNCCYSFEGLVDGVHAEPIHGSGMVGSETLQKFDASSGHITRWSMLKITVTRTQPEFSYVPLES